MGEQPSLHVPARDLPVPRHLSEPAQAFLGAPRPAETSPYPSLDDAEAWREQIAERWPQCARRAYVVDAGERSGALGTCDGAEPELVARVARAHEERRLWRPPSLARAA